MEKKVAQLATELAEAAQEPVGELEKACDHFRAYDQPLAPPPPRARAPRSILKRPASAPQIVALSRSGGACPQNPGESRDRRQRTGGRRISGKELDLPRSPITKTPRHTPHLPPHHRTPTPHTTHTTHTDTHTHTQPRTLSHHSTLLTLAPQHAPFTHHPPHPTHHPHRPHSTLLTRTHHTHRTSPPHHTPPLAYAPHPHQQQQQQQQPSPGRVQGRPWSPRWSPGPALDSALDSCGGPSVRPNLFY